MERLFRGMCVCFSCRTSHVTRHTSHVTRRMSHVTRHTSHVTRHTSHFTIHTSLVTRHTSHVTPHTSHVTLHVSHVTRHTSRFINRRSASACAGATARICVVWIGVLIAAVCGRATVLLLLLLLLLLLPISSFARYFLPMLTAPCLPRDLAHCLRACRCQ